MYTPTDTKQFLLVGQRVDPLYRVLLLQLWDMLFDIPHVVPETSSGPKLSHALDLPVELAELIAEYFTTLCGPRMQALHEFDTSMLNPGRAQGRLR